MTCAEIICASAVTLIALTIAARAEDPAALFDRVFAKVDGGTPCYARTYDAQHLKRHPRQRVLAISIAYPTPYSDYQQSAHDRFELGLAIHFKGERRSDTGWTAICGTGEKRFGCSVDGGGGGFKLLPNGDKALKLVVDSELTVETHTDFVDVSDRKFDDREFILPRARFSECPGRRISSPSRCRATERRAENENARARRASSP